MSFYEMSLNLNFCGIVCVLRIEDVHCFTFKENF